MDDAFRKIQLHEAAIAEGEAALRASPTCKQAQALRDAQICEAARDLCEIADEIEDTDALHRCLIADDTCRGAREQVRSLCATPQPTHE